MQIEERKEKKEMKKVYGKKRTEKLKAGLKEANKKAKKAVVQERAAALQDMYPELETKAKRESSN